MKSYLFIGVMFLMCQNLGAQIPQPSLRRSPQPSELTAPYYAPTVYRLMYITSFNITPPEYGCYSLFTGEETKAQW